MLKILALTLVVASNLSFAGHLDTVCESAVKAPPVFEMGFVARRVSSFKTVIEDFDGKVITETPAKIVALVRDAGTLWALTPTQLVQMTLDGNVEFTYNFEGSENPMWVAMNMTQFGRKLVITRGLAGMMAIDMDTQEVAWTNTLNTGDAGFPNGITTDGRVLYVASATAFEKGFTGILTVDPMNGQILKQTAYDVYRWGVLANDVNARMVGENLVLNNGGWIHYITKKQIEDKKDIRPRWVAEVVPASGSVNAHYMMMAGDFLIHDGQVMGCGVFTAEENSAYVRKSKLVHLKLP